MIVEDAITPRSLLEDNAAVYCITARPGSEKHQALETDESISFAEMKDRPVR